MEFMNVDTDEEYDFFMTHKIMNRIDYYNLVKSREVVNKKIKETSVTIQELNAHSRVELNLFMICKQKIKDEMKKDLVDLELVDTSIIKIQCNRIIIIFNCMRLLFQIDRECLIDYINFCQHNVRYLSDVDQLDGLVSAVLGINDLECWVKLLKIFISSKLHSLDHVYKVFRLGVDFLKNNSTPLWELMITYLKHIRSNNMITKSDESEIVPKIQCGYLEWAVQVYDLNYARKLFQKLTDQVPRYQIFYTSMINIETSQKKPDYNKIRRLHYDTCMQFGRNNIDIWISFIRFEFVHGTQSTVTHTYRNSIAILHPELIDNMIEAFRLLKIEYGFQVNYLLYNHTGKNAIQNKKNNDNNLLVITE